MNPRRPQEASKTRGPLAFVGSWPPRGPKRPPRRPKRPPRGPKTAQDGPKTPPRGPKDAPKTRQVRPKTALKLFPAPKTPQDTPKRVPRGPKMPPRGPQDTPKRAQRHPQDAQSSYITRRLQEASQKQVSLAFGGSLKVLYIRDSQVKGGFSRQSPPLRRANPLGPPGRAPWLLKSSKVL